MAYNGSSGKRVCTGVEHISERSNGGGSYGISGQTSGQGEPKRKRDLPSRPNHILLYTIVNPAYPITVDVIHTISSPYGQVQRIVIFKKNGVQAMVEFDNQDAATNAKEELNGADIYSGCCTLKIEFAKPEKLNVFKNDQDSWDYTVKDETTPPQQRSAPLLQSPQYTGGRPQPYSFNDGQRQRPLSADPPGDFGPGEFRRRPGGRFAPASHSGMRRPPFFDRDDLDDASAKTAPAPGSRVYDCGSPSSSGSVCDGIHDMDFSGGPPPGPGLMKEPRGHHMHHHHHQGHPMAPYGNSGGPHHHGALGLPAPMPSSHGCVLMVYGLDTNTANADRLFNLVCLYGNVVRIKFLKTKEGTAMVQMGDALSVERCVQNLNNVTVGEHTLTLAFSKQTYLSEVMNPYPLQDKSPSFKEYVGNKNNRFMTAASIHKNRIQPPSKILHFFNTPPDVTEEQLLSVFNDYGVEAPLHISKFPLKSEKSSSGLMEFANSSQAVQAIMACNHATITHPGAKFPFVMKLCFSSARSISSGQHGGNKQQNFNNNNNANAEQMHQDNDDDCQYE